MSQEVEGKKLLDLILQSLRDAGLSPDPRQVERRTFAFGEGDHYVVGSVISIGYGPEEGVLLFVTSPRFRGMDIRYIGHKNGAWTARGHKADESRPGTFIFL